jgi:hypothetical protein
MRSAYVLVLGKVLVFAAGIFITLSICGCGDPVVAEFEANRRRMGETCKRDLGYATPTFTPANRAPAFRPAP